MPFLFGPLSCRIKSPLWCLLVPWQPRPSQEHHLLVPHRVQQNSMGGIVWVFFFLSKTSHSGEGSPGFLLFQSLIQGGERHEVTTMACPEQSPLCYLSADGNMLWNTLSCRTEVFPLLFLQKSLSWALLQEL